MNKHQLTSITICLSLIIPQTLHASSDFSDVDPIIINLPNDRPGTTTPGIGGNDGRVGINPVPGTGVAPGNGNGNRVGVGNGNNSNNTPTIGNINQTLVPGITCPLVDNQPHKDLVAAADNLAKNLAPLKQCKDSADIDTMQGYLTSVTAAGKNLKSYIDQPELITSENGKLKNIQDNVDTLVRGINNISIAFSSSSLLDSSCAKDMMNGTDIILSLSDLIQSVTPFAVSALEANPAFAPAIPYVIGLSAAGNIAKVVKKINDEKSLHMDDPKIRQAVLQNICEYTRIVQRASSYKAAKRGDMRDVNDHLGTINSFRKKLFASYSSSAIQEIQAGDDVKDSLKTVSKTAVDDQIAINDLRQQINGEQDSNLSCYIVRGLVAQAGNHKELPTRAIDNLKLALKNKSYINESAQIIQVGLLNAEKNLRTQILSRAKKNSPRELMACAKEGKSYIEALTRLVQSTQNIAVGMQGKVDENLENSDNPDVRDLAKVAHSAQSEKDKLDALARSAAAASNIRAGSAKSKGMSDIKLLQSLNRDNGVIGDADIDRNLMEIRAELFGPRAGLIGGNSPAMAWYIDADAVLRKRNLDFLREVRELTSEAQRYYTESGQNGSIPVTYAFLPLIPSEEMIDDASAAYNLDPLNLKTLPEGSPEQGTMCLRLNNVLNTWQGVLDHLGSMMLFCSYLSNYMDTSFDGHIVQACNGVKDWNGNIYKKSDLLQLRQQLAERSVRKAQLISKKISDLRCPQP